MGGQARERTAGDSNQPRRLGLERVVAKGIVKTFGSTAALRGVDAVFEPGLTLIQGANGSGKSTLLRILSTLSRPTAGTVRYDPVGDDPELARREIGWVSHELLAYPELSGRENVELAAELHGLDPREAWTRATERFGLGRFAERPVRTYSRGQRQRVALARGLVHEPSLVLLDEPTTGLDRSGVEGLLETVALLVEEEAIVVVVTHEPAAFEKLATAAVVLERGRVVAGAG